ncbi:hypothetical protein CK203_105068 [Vitis vinifera]|uniref:Uncharacterized protein n=1 Tax=Vitis vinifera TaxID=29760 RepID=A0A438FEC9_VITVI|nr:hypothetical protein CK203_105068 [Vitis vinifera]
MATETPAVPVMVPDEVAPGETHPAVNVEAPNPEQESPSRLISQDVRDGGTLVVVFRGMANNDLFTDLLRTTDYMKAFASRRKDTLRADLAEARAGRNHDRPLHEAEDEMARLRGVRQLRTEASIEKKQKEDLQLRLTAQKEELEREFAAEREELEADYQKQVDDTFIFGYRCCMKKNGIKRCPFNSSG